MCGIVAMHAVDTVVSPDLLGRATRRLAHRGPDAQRIWIAPDGRVGLGHARLSIIDLATGDQPMASEDESLRIVVNGEFYDFERIRRDLEARGHRFRTRSDSEIALHLYEDWGAQCLHHLRGEFAFALWDGPNRTLFAARDRFGIKPLYFAVLGDALVLASEAKALFALGIPARWDRQGMYLLSSLTVPAGERTRFAGVYQVPPGHYLIASRGHFRLFEYWDFDYPAADGAGRTIADEDAVERFRVAFDEAVRLRLRADVPVGCYLSGGLDSCSVLGFAARHRSEPIRAFTITFAHHRYDEGGIAEEMAAHAGADYHPVPVRQADLADHFADAVWQAETQFVNAHGVAKYLLSRAVRDAGYRVVLTGEGSDEVLAGYPTERRDMLLHDSQGQDPDEVRRLLDELARSNPVSRGLQLPEGPMLPMDGLSRAIGFVPSWMEAVAATAARVGALLADDFLAEFADYDPSRDFLSALDVRRQIAGRAPIHRSLYLWSKAILANYILCVLGDRMEMAHSVEGRVPFLDHRVVELARDLPVRLKIRGMTEKFVLREAARPVLTETVYRRQKHPFLSPPAALTPGERLYELVQDTLRGPGLAAVPFYDQAKVVALLDQLPALGDEARTVMDPVLMILLSTCCLQERFGLG